MTSPAKLAEWAADPAAFVLDLTFPTRQGPRRFGDVATDFQRDWLAAMAPSFLAVAAGEAPPTPKFWIEASKNCSKTTIVAALILWLLIFRRKPGNGVAGAVDKDNAAEVLLAARELLAENTHLADRVEIQAWAIIGKHTDCVVEIVATDRKGSQGGRPMLTYVDECSHVDDGSFEFVRNVLDDASKTGGLTIVTSNAGWTDTAAFDLRELARTSPLWTFLRWDKPSPLTPVEELRESERRNSPSRHRRLHWTEWGPRDEGDALDPRAIEAIQTLLGPQLYAEPRHMARIGTLDLGLRKNHSAFLVLGIDVAAAKIELLHSQSWRPPAGGEIQLADVRGAIFNSHYRFGLDALVFDEWQAAALAQDCSARGIPTLRVNYSAASLREKATILLQVLADRSLAIYPQPDLVRDLGRVSIVEKVDGFRVAMPVDSKTGSHCDLASALIQALPICVTWHNEILRGLMAPSRPPQHGRQQYTLPEPCSAENPHPDSLEAIMARGDASGSMRQLGSPGAHSFGPRF